MRRLPDVPEEGCGFVKMPSFAARTAAGAAILLLTVNLVPVWAEEIDCEDKDNAGLPECQTTMTPSTPAVEAPPQENTAPEAPPAPPQGPVMYNGSPMDMLFTLADAGKEATRTKLDESSDSRSKWAHIRFERGLGQQGSGAESGSQDTLGPRVIDHTIYVATSFDNAKAIYKEEVARNPRFPEKGNDPLGGTFPWKLENLVEQTEALSACNDCNGRDQLFLHHRIVQQRNNVVSILYLYGRDKRGTEEITTQKESEIWQRKVAERI